MADNKMGPNLQAGAGFLAKRVQKSLNRAQEKVLQKLGKTMETKDEHFELCFRNLNKQQIDGCRLFKDFKAYYAAVKGVHETSKRLSQTLRDVYESDWMGVQDLGVIAESEDLLLNDFEEKLSDQIVRTMENYTSQFPEVKERVAKRGRKLVDYDSARHHLEALQGAKKKDEAKISKAEEEFNEAQNVFEEINNELREELPVLYQSRIGCYVTVFQNISNLRDVFYKEMSVLNNELYNVMKKLETQHSGKAFVIKGLNSTTTKSKKRTSLVISNPIPCNTAFPTDHVSIQSSNQNGKDPAPTSVQRTQSISEGGSPPEESSFPSKDSSSSESDFSSSGANTPKRRSTCDKEGGTKDGESQSTEEAESQSEDSRVGEQQLEGVCQEASSLYESAPESPDQDTANNPPAGEDEVKPPPEEDEVKPPPEEDEVKPPPEEDEVKPPQEDEVKPPQEDEVKPPPEEDQPKPPPVPAPRVSFRSNVKPPLRSANTPKEMEEELVDQETMEDSHNPPGFLYKGVALESHAASEEGLLQFEHGDVILVLDDTLQQEGLLRGIREESWKQHRCVENHSGIFLEKLIQPE